MGRWVDTENVASGSSDLMFKCFFVFETRLLSVPLVKLIVTCLRKCVCAVGSHFSFTLK